MKDRHCETCGAPLAATYEKNDLYFYIDDNGKVVRDTNQDLLDVGFFVHCSNDLTHNIGPIHGQKGFQEFEEWKDQFEGEVLKIMAEEN